MTRNREEIEKAVREAGVRAKVEHLAISPVMAVVDALLPRIVALEAKTAPEENHARPPMGAKCCRCGAPVPEWFGGFFVSADGCWWCPKCLEAKAEVKDGEGHKEGCAGGVGSPGGPPPAEASGSSRDSHRGIESPTSPSPSLSVEEAEKRYAEAVMATDKLCYPPPVSPIGMERAAARTLIDALKSDLRESREAGVAGDSMYTGMRHRAEDYERENEQLRAILDGHEPRIRKLRDRAEAAEAKLKIAEEALCEVDRQLTNLQPHIPQACMKGHEGFIDSHVDVAIEAARGALSKIQAGEEPLARHEFKGSFDRDCEICGYPDRYAIHKVATGDEAGA